MQLRAVLFDLGDTLLEFDALNPWEYLHEGILRVHAWLGRRNGQTPNVDVYARRARRAIRKAYFWSLLRRREVDVFDVLGRLHLHWGIDLSREELKHIAELFYQPLRERGRVNPTSIDVLTRLQTAGLKLGLISNTFVPGDLLDDHLAEEKLLEFFPVRVYSCDVRYLKPDERIFLTALKGLQVDPGQAIFVGDTPAIDVRGANRLGITSVWLRRGQPADRRYPPKHQIRRLTELTEIVERYRTP